MNFETCRRPRFYQIINRTFERVPAETLWLRVIKYIIVYIILIHGKRKHEKQFSTVYTTRGSQYPRIKKRCIPYRKPCAEKNFKNRDTCNQNKRLSSAADRVQTSSFEKIEEVKKRWTVSMRGVTAVCNYIYHVHNVYSQLEILGNPSMSLTTCRCSMSSIIWKDRRGVLVAIGTNACRGYF